MRGEQQIQGQNPIIIVQNSDEEGKSLISKMIETIKIEGFNFYFNI